MSYRKGEITKRQIMREWPHHVGLAVPEGGFGKRLDVMFSFCKGMDYKTASEHGPGKPDGVWWCFRSKEDAERFAAVFATPEDEAFPLNDARVSGWRFRVIETSSNTYIVEGRDQNGRSVTRQGTGQDALLEECVQDALRYDETCPHRKRAAE